MHAEKTGCNEIQFAEYHGAEARFALVGRYVPFHSLCLWATNTSIAQSQSEFDGCPQRRRSQFSAACGDQWKQPLSISGSGADSLRESALLPAMPLKPLGAMQDGNKPWTLNFRDAPWSTVVRELSKSMGLSLSMSFEPAGTFTYFDDQRYSTSEVIDIINDHLIPLGAILIRNDQRLTMVSTQQPINDSIVPFISVAEIDLVGRNEIAGTAIPIKGVDPMQAVSEISLVKSPVGQVRSFANSQRIVIIDTGTHLRRIRDLLLQTGFARSDTISSVYQLRHAKSEDVAKAINDFLSGQNSSPDAKQLTNLPVGAERVVAEKTTNSLIVRGSQETLPIIMRIICDLDRSPREVLLQALIVEVLVSNTKEFGVEVGLQDSVLFDRSIVNSIQTVNQTSTAPNGVQTTNQSILSQQVSPGFNFNGPVLGANAVNPSRIGVKVWRTWGLDASIMSSVLEASFSPPDRNR